MKSFLRFIGRCIKWSCIVAGGCCLLGIVLLLALALFGGKDEPIKDHSILVLNLNNGIVDRPPGDGSGELLRLLKRERTKISLRAMTESLRNAASDKRIAAVYLHGSINPSGYESGFAALKEVREALNEFRKSGKPVIAYLVDANQRDLYLTSAAEQIWLNPSGVIEFQGMAANGVFFKRAGDKFGVQFEPTRHGKYKSAIEPFLREDYSAENREQLGALLQSNWHELVQSVATSRKIRPEALQTLADNEMILRADKAKAAGLIDGTAYEGDMIGKLRAITGEGKNDADIPQVAMARYAQEALQTEREAEHTKDKIAIVYAEGEIKDGVAEGGSEDGVFGDSFARMLRKLSKDEHVKAVVLRVNSPGGSATASDVILDELRRLHETRPVIVSMGTVAASGGYLISTAADRILAEPNTITGSIGVFGMRMNIKKLANDYGVTFDAVKTAAHADSGSVLRPMDEFEQLKMQELVDSIYMDFLKSVAACRKMTTNQVDELAQGRIWSGTDALKHGLVDELGGLDAAVSEAAKRAKLDRYAVVEYPAKSDLLQELLDELSDKRDPLASLGLPPNVTGELRAQIELMKQFNSPSGVYARMPFGLSIH